MYKYIYIAFSQPYAIPIHSYIHATDNSVQTYFYIIFYHTTWREGLGSCAIRFVLRRRRNLCAHSYKSYVKRRLY